MDKLSPEPSLKSIRFNRNTRLNHPKIPVSHLHALQTCFQGDNSTWVKWECDEQRGWVQWERPSLKWVTTNNFWLSNQPFSYASSSSLYTSHSVGGQSFKTSIASGLASLSLTFWNILRTALSEMRNFSFSFWDDPTFCSNDPLSNGESAPSPAMPGSNVRI